MLLSRPVLRLSRTATSWPAAMYASATWEPMNPAPPVTRIRTRWTVTGLLAGVVERRRLEVEVFKAVRSPVPPSFLRRLLQRAATVPEVEARLPTGEALVAVRLTGDEGLRR